MVDKSRLDVIYSAVNERLVTRLRLNSSVMSHPTMKGDGAEIAWVELLTSYLPGRYKVGSGKIIDCNGEESQQIDVVIYDNTYAPLLYTESGGQYITAESVYAVFEVKPTLNKAYITYAENKIESVRKLHRTSAPVFSIHGKTEPKPLFDILGGILTFTSEYEPVIGETLLGNLSYGKSDRIDFGCVATDAAFSIIYSNNEACRIDYSTKYPVASFYLMLLERLSCLATAPAIEYDRYQSVFEKKKYPEQLD